jgi:hypothetical protein
VADYSDIVFQFNCDSDTTGVSPTRGSGTITIDGGILLNTTDKIEGTGCLDQNNAGNNNFKFDISGNFDYTNSRIGFWFNPQEDLTNTGWVISTTANTSNGFQSRPYNDGGGRLSLSYLGANSASNSLFGESVGTWYYIEISFSDTEAKMYIDGSLYQTTSAGANSFTDTSIIFGALDGNALDALYDEIRISNNKDRDLYAIRNTVIS